MIYIFIYLHISFFLCSHVFKGSFLCLYYMSLCYFYESIVNKIKVEARVICRSPSSVLKILTFHLLEKICEWLLLLPIITYVCLDLLYDKTLLLKGHTNGKLNGRIYTLRIMNVLFLH